MAVLVCLVILQTRIEMGNKSSILSYRLCLIFGVLLGIITLLLIAGAASIPFYFESSTILYKFGLDRHLLRFGQVVGTVAGVLLLLQIILSARLKCLDRVFGLNNLFKFHRLTGISVACLILVHPILIFIPEDRITIPFEWRYWPEFIGIFLLLLIVATVITSHWRTGLRLPFHRWWPIHRAAAILIIVVFWVHVLAVNDTFEQKPLKMLAHGAIGISGFLFIWIRTRRLRNQRKTFRVSTVEQVGKDAVRLKIISKTQNMLVYVPGQFSFLRFLSPHISDEEHPFTIASSPTGASFIEFVVRTTGDWTAQLKDLRQGDKVILDGPFGHFSHLQLPAKKEVIMIAGGIGITPMLSMLRYMADHQDPRKITLIWINKTRKHIIFPHEFQNLAARLNGLRNVHVLTRDPEFDGEKGRLDRSRLKRLVSECSPSAAIFVCGPDQMMKDVFKFMVAMGFPKRMISMEQFRL